jgi:hypothetical protein
MTIKTIEMPDVAACDATDCAYNKEGDCHARAITVGDGAHPGCDTFMRSRDHSRRPDGAGVGACKVKACKHNDDFECQASAIRVGRGSDTVECLTFARR